MKLFSAFLLATLISPLAAVASDFQVVLSCVGSSGYGSQPLYATVVRGNHPNHGVLYSKFWNHNSPINLSKITSADLISSGTDAARIDADQVQFGRAGSGILFVQSKNSIYSSNFPYGWASCTEVDLNIISSIK